MGRSYSLDLRERVIAFLEKGNDTKSTGELFGISQRTVQRWHRQKNERGTLRPLQRKNYVEGHPDQFLHEITQEFSVTLQAIFYPCKKLKLTRKKDKSIQRERFREKEDVS